MKTTETNSIEILLQEILNRLDYQFRSGNTESSEVIYNLAKDALLILKEKTK